MKKTSSIKTFAGLVSAALIVACSGGADDKDVSSQAPASSDAQADANYSFFVAGHAYGTPQTKANGLHDPFKAQLNALLATGYSPDFGILTGDVVPRDTAENWTALNSDLSALDTPIYIAPGNHDVRFGANADFVDLSDKVFRKGRDLFVVLNNTSNNWGLSADQIALVQKEMASVGPDGNVFMFLHHLAWYEADNQYQCIDTNPKTAKDGPSNFMTEVMPLLKRAGNPVYVFAGDTGAVLSKGPSYSVVDNITLLAGGMGGGNGHYFTVDVNDGEVDVKLNWLYDQVNPAFTATRNKEIATNSIEPSDYDVQCMTVRSADRSRSDFDASGTTIYTLGDDNFSLLNFTRTSRPGEAIRLRADNDNPIVLLNGLPIKDDMDYVMRLQFRSSVESRGGLFLSQVPPQAPPAFDIARQIKFDAQGGNNTHYIDFNGSKVGTKLRIDPISEAGTIDLQNIEIREVPRFGG